MELHFKLKWRWGCGSVGVGLNYVLCRPPFSDILDDGNVSLLCGPPYWIS